MLELDKRIINNAHPYDCFSNAEEVSQYSNGWFSNNLDDFTNLDNTTFGSLTAITDSNYPFQSEKGFYKFFLPVCMVKVEEKVFRPYTIEEFQKIFTLGSPIKFRRKDDKEHPYNLIFLGYTWLNDRIAVEIGHEKYFLDVLLNDFEWYNEYKVEYTPFGVAV